MSIDFAIIGLERSGKTTIFCTLAGVRLATVPPKVIGTTKVPDPRLKTRTRPSTRCPSCRTQ